MSLTKNDLEQIKGVVIEVVDERIDPKIDAAVKTVIASTLSLIEPIIIQLDDLYEDMAIVKDYVKDQKFRITKLEKRLEKA